MRPWLPMPFERADPAARDPGAWDEVALLGRATQDPQVLHAALDALLALDPARATATLVDMALDAPIDRRSQILERLLDEPERYGTAPVAALVADGDDRVAALAAELAARLPPDPETDAALLDAATRPALEVQQAALESLARRGVSVDVSLIERVSASAPLGVQLAAVRLACHSDDARAAAFLLDCAVDGPPLVRVAAIEGLGGFPSAREALAAAIPLDAPQTDRAALWRALARIGGLAEGTLRARLERALADPSIEIRTAALSASVRLLGDEALRSVVALADDPPYDATFAVAGPPGATRLVVTTNDGTLLCDQPIELRRCVWESRAFGPRRAVVLSAERDPFFGGRELRAVCFPDVDPLPP